MNFFDLARANRMTQLAQEIGRRMKSQIKAARPMREARRRMGWTQFELAKRVHCSESQIAKIETGRVTPDEILREAIGKELNIPAWEVGV